MPTLVNGSIWTLPIEARMYLYVAVLCALGWTKTRWVANSTIAALVLLSFIKPEFLPRIFERFSHGMINDRVRLDARRSFVGVVRSLNVADESRGSSGKSLGYDRIAVQQLV